MMEKQNNGYDSKCNNNTAKGYNGKRASQKKAIECRKDISVKYLVSLNCNCFFSSFLFYFYFVEFLIFLL